MTTATSGTRKTSTRAGTLTLVPRSAVKHLAFFEASYFGFVFDRPYPEPIPAVDQNFRKPDLMWVPTDETRQQVIESFP